MRDIIGQEIKVGDVVCKTAPKQSYLDINMVIEVKPNSIETDSIERTYNYIEGKRSSSNVIILSGQQLASLFNLNPRFGQIYKDKLKHYKIKK
jgi:hypothetical protein